MPGFDRDQIAIGNTVENRRLGSVMLTAGWTFVVDGCPAAYLLLLQFARRIDVLADLAGSGGSSRAGAGDCWYAIPEDGRIVMAGNSFAGNTIRQEREDEEEEKHVR